MNFPRCSRGGGGQEKIPGTYGGLGGCPEYTFCDSFLPLRISSDGKSLLFGQFQQFFCIFVSDFALFCQKTTKLNANTKSESSTSSKVGQSLVKETVKTG